MCIRLSFLIFLYFDIKLSWVVNVCILMYMVLFCVLWLGELGMGVIIDKLCGNIIVEGVLIKSVIEGGLVVLVKSYRGVGLKLGMYNMVDMVLV